MEDVQFEKLKKEIEEAWEHYALLQKIFIRETGQEYRWLK